MTGSLEAPVSMPIWVNHAHVFPEGVRPQGSVGALLRLLDECGIEGAVCFAPFASQLAQAGIEGNGWLAEAIRPCGDRLVGFGTIDLEGGDTGGQVGRIRELGFRGIKLHPAVQRFHVLSDPLLEVYGRAEELGLFLCFHTGVHHARLSDARLIDFDEIAYRFPRLRFSLEHVGGYAFYREAVGVIQNNLGRPHSVKSAGPLEAGGTAGTAGTAGTVGTVGTVGTAGVVGVALKGTVYAGLTSVFSARELAWYLPPSGPDSIETLVAQIGADHVVFGLDFPYKSAAYIREAIGIVRGLAIADRDKAQILGGTLRALLMSFAGQAR